MGTILFPTDFSALSKNAFAYALEYAKKTYNSITVFHAWEPGTPVDKDMADFYNAVDIANFRNRRDIFPPFEKMKAEKEYVNVDIHYVVEEGRFMETFENYVDANSASIELIVMGTYQNPTSIYRFFMETKTLKILEKTREPVIAIPQTADFDGHIDHLLFITDFSEAEMTALTSLMKTIKAFGAQLHVVHLDQKHNEDVTHLMDDLKKQLTGNAIATDNIQFANLDTTDIKKTIQEYCTANAIDIVYIVNQQMNFYQRIFSYSLAEELLENVKVPVMVLSRG